MMGRGLQSRCVGGESVDYVVVLRTSRPFIGRLGLLVAAAPAPRISQPPSTQPWRASRAW